MLIVRNNEPRLIDIPAAPVGSPGGGVHTPFVIKLRPGANLVDPEQWGQVEKFSTVKTLVRLKHLAPESKQAADVGKLPLDEAVALAGEIMDRKTLREWRSEETRGKVKRAIDAQIAKITPEAKSTADTDEG